MPALNPPGYTQGAGPSARLHRLESLDATLQPASGSTVRAQRGVKVGGGTPLKVDAGTGLAVSVSPGTAFVEGTQVSLQGTYSCVSDGAVALALAAADATNPRRDRIIARVYDPEYGAVPAGLENTWRLEVVTGTPAATPALPAEPASSITLADVLVNAGATVPTSITDLRGFVTGLGGIGRGAVAGAHDGQYRDNAGRLERYDGAAWDNAGGAVSDPVAVATALATVAAWPVHAVTGLRRSGAFLSGTLAVTNNTGAAIAPSTAGNIADQVVGTLAAGFRPLVEAAFSFRTVAAGGGWGSILTDGRVILAEAAFPIPAGALVILPINFLIA